MILTRPFQGRKIELQIEELIYTCFLLHNCLQ